MKRGWQNSPLHRSASSLAVQNNLMHPYLKFPNAKKSKPFNPRSSIPLPIKIRAIHLFFIIIIIDLVADQDVVHPGQDVGSTSPHPEPTPLEPPADLPGLDPYTKGASFESFEAAKDALLWHTVARGLSYKVLRSDKTRSRYLVSCLSSSCPFRIRFGPNASGGVMTTVVPSTAQLPSGDPFELAAGKVGQIPRLEDDRGEGLESFVNHLLPATARARDARYGVRFDEESESASAVSEG